MRTLLLVLFILVCMAATIRIEGVWSPAPLIQRVELAVQRAVEPGKALLSSIHRQLLPAKQVFGRSLGRLDVGAPASTPDRSDSPDSRSAVCG